MLTKNHLDFSRALEAGITAAHAAAAILQAYAHDRSELIIDHKSRNDLVSQADREAETAILEHLTHITPEFGIVAEETGGQPTGSATWYIDPLDGTTNFLHGIPHYAVSLGLIAHAGTQLLPDTPVLTRDTPVVSVVYDPCREELFTAIYQEGSRLNGERIYCSTSQSLSDSLLGTGVPFRDFSFADQYMPTFESALHTTRGIRRLGAAALDLAWIACGRFDAYWEMGLAPWDVAAGTLLVREAGGQAEDMYGMDPWPIKGYVAAANQQVFPELMAMLKPHLTAPVIKKE
ncbi:inositol monophosphatase [Advenella faeciporci]|uniref:Inositol-1-monophosphatase n=1 Tax=Advenella faeciporci TaxID=797535 RepID=A0A918JMQ6_9BURK|nr:inositol monophosphatase family protein [Advenella faeciporci]GGW90238.1 inositol monophosphatase [Advenella faeciporci]